MASLEEPTVSELIRDLQSSVQGVADDVKELKDLQANYVSKELYDVHRQMDHERLRKLEERRQQWWTIFVLPVMVGVALWFIQGVIVK